MSTDLSADSSVLELHGADSSTVIEYSREHIPGDREMAPYDLTGSRRLVFLALYGLIVASSFTGLIYTFYVSPFFALAVLPVCYVFNNLLFTLSHSRLHASFIELPEARMSVVCHHSFIHHYRNSCVYHEKWLETRMSYFMDTRIIFDHAFRGFSVAIPVASVILYLVDPVLGIAFFSSHYVAELLQSTIHEWYHNPVRNRKTFYIFPVYWTLTFLEKIGVASTKHHVAHHRHQLPNLDKVEVWLDLYLPFGEIPATLLWKRALARYVPGQTRMTEYVSRAGSLFALVAFSIINPAIYIAIFFAFFG